MTLLRFCAIVLLLVAPQASVGASLAIPQMVQAEVFPEPERCPKFFASAKPQLHTVAATRAAATAEDVHITFIGHSTYLIESPAGVRIATDYNDSIRPSGVVDIATMNRAHITHYSLNPDPNITHLLPGWGQNGEPAVHDLTFRDVWLRNVTTNIRGGGFGDPGYTQRDMNSMFVFEVSGLCIAHLGHLHHTLTEDHLKALGRVDVVMVPVDGGRTLSVGDMLKVLRDLQSPVVMPMHFFGRGTLARFVSELSEIYDIQTLPADGIGMSRANLPPVPTVYVPQGF